MDLPANQTASRRWEDFNVQFTGVPMSQGLAHIESVFEAGSKFFRFRKVVPDQIQSHIFDMRPEAFDGIVFRRPTALSKGIP